MSIWKIMPLNDILLIWHIHWYTRSQRKKIHLSPLSYFSCRLNCENYKIYSVNIYNHVHKENRAKQMNKNTLNSLSFLFYSSNIVQYFSTSMAFLVGYLAVLPFSAHFLMRFANMNMTSISDRNLHIWFVFIVHHMRGEGTYT